MVCVKGFSWNPSNYECECDTSCGIGEYLDYKSCVCKKTLVHKLVEEYTSVIEENKIYNETSGIPSSDSGSCTAYVVLFVVFLLLCLITSGVFIYFYWYKRSNKEKNDAGIGFNPKIQVNYINIYF